MSAAAAAAPSTVTLESIGLFPGAAFGLEGPAPAPGAPVTGLAVDSREVKPGFVFFAIPGTRLDGAEFIPYALRMDASAIVATPDGAARMAPADGWPVPVLTTETPRRALALAAAAFYGAQPAVMAAVTGTNGKTSTAHFLRQIWCAAGLPAASLGTTGIEGGTADAPHAFDSALGATTPEPITLHAALARLAGAGCSHAVMEASSHGLAQHRTDGVRLRAAALTHITRDHLDYHADHEAYVAAKLRLFGEVLLEGGAAVINLDDPVAARAVAMAEARGQRLITTGRHERADLRLLEQRFRTGGQDLVVSYQGKEHAVALGLVGTYQAENVLTAAALALGTGLDADTVFAVLPGLRTVRGRMELAGYRANGAAVYVDYAHTPGALASALASLRPHATGNLVCAFGAGGDRDRGKRPLMGEAVAKGADIGIVTDDNPRSEDPALIRAAVFDGARAAAGRPSRIQNIGGRAEAILAGVDALEGAGDVLLIAGKGHEQGQEVAGEMLPFDDVEQARTAIAVLDGDALGELGP
ncbi:MAG: UDP-N-acetylmuramoyl-L-alanyl-D-glutamate--2,6-diaminopimelate ligase [Pseudomonadota bacterium]